MTVLFWEVLACDGFILGGRRAQARGPVKNYRTLQNITEHYRTLQNITEHFTEHYRTLQNITEHYRT